MSMKKTIALLAALCIFSMSAFAQDKQCFNHLALGPTIGVDGLGVDLVAPISSQFQIRAGYAIDPIPISFTANLGSVSSGSKTINLNNTPLSFSPWKSGNGHLLIDFYPSKTGGFHISAGLFVNNGKPISAKADLTRILDKADWGTLAAGPEGGFQVSTDMEGQLKIDFKTWAVNPYVGVGFGRALNPEKTFNFVFDMGVMVWGRPSFQGYDYTETPMNKPVKTVSLDADSVSKLNQTAGKLVYLASAFPVCPYIRFGFYFKLF